MRKQIRTLIIVTVSVLLLVGLLLTLLFLVPETSEETSSETTSSDTSVTLIDKSSSITVTNAVFKTPTEEYEISLNSDSVLTVTSYAALPVGTSEIKSLTTDLTDLTADRMVADNSDKAADYGLSSPQATVAVTYSDNSTITIELGNESPLKDGYYARISGDKSIYLVDTTFGEMLLQSSTTYIGTSVITAPTVDSSDSSGEAVLQAMTLSGTVRESNPFRFRLYSADTDSTDLSTFTYLVTSPSVLGVSDDDASDIVSVTSLTASEAFKAYPTDEELATYGLANPYSKCVMTLAVQTSSDSDGDGEDETSYYNAAEHTVILGNTNDDGDYYALIDDYDVIYLVSASSVPWVKTQMNDICSKFLFMNNITTVDAITVVNSGTTTTFDLTHYPDETASDAKLAVTVDGTTYSTSSFRSLYQVFMTVNRYEETTETPSGDPEVTFRIQFVDTTKSDFVARFYKLTTSTYLCVTESGDTYTVKSSSLKNMLTQLNNYLNGKSVSTS